MASINETAYPRIKANISENELAEIYTPNMEELKFADTHTRSPTAKVGLLLLLKTFQRLGYFLTVAEIAPVITLHVAKSAGFTELPAGMLGYDQSGSRTRHLDLVRSYAGITAYGPAAKHAMITAAVEAARTKDELADIINVTMEELVRQRYELPAFDTLLRVANKARATVHRGYHQRVYTSLGLEARTQLDTLLKRSPGESRSLWDKLKREPKRPTIKEMNAFINHLQWLGQHNVGVEAFADIPDSKMKQFAAEARALDLTSLNDIREHKRYTLVAALIREQVARSLDDVAKMFIRRIQTMHAKARTALADYQAEHVDRTDALIDLLRETVGAYKTEGTKETRFDAIDAVIGPEADNILERCQAHGAYAGHNYFPFLTSFYKGARSVLFAFVESVPLISTSQDRSLEQAIAFLRAHKKSKGEWLDVVRREKRDFRREETIPLVELSWVQEKWWKLVTRRSLNETRVTQVDRKYFELCLFSQIMQELKSGDLCIPGSDHFSDYRKQLISEDEYKEGLEAYGPQAGIAVEGKAFIAELRQRLESVAQSTDRSFPDNEYVRIEEGEPVLSKLERKPDPDGFRLIERRMKEGIPPVNILDAIADTEYWLKWTRHFGPLSGFETKLDLSSERYIITAFCYACGFGPTQTARSFKTLDRKQIAFVNQRHITEEILDQAIASIVNDYNRFTLPKYWGSGRHAGADGTKWDLYEQNLLSEYHIRHGGYGGIGYYHLSDLYIALFSHFIPCGVWEGHYILDVLQKNTSDVQPDTLHSDTQGQSAPIFGLAYLLGIDLMPRIRNWKNLKFYRPAKGARYKHIDQLFSADIDWELIEALLPDMLRVAMSIKAGRITPSTILRKLGTYSHKNKLYFAFRELGRVLRTEFLLKYLSDIELRRMIQGATNKNEAFNRFIQWVSFGGGGVIAENVREEQRKVIKYNHLVANLLIYYNVVAMTRSLQDLVQAGHTVTKEILARLSPYQTEHINRFGTYTLHLDRTPTAPEYQLALNMKAIRAEQ